MPAPVSRVPDIRRGVVVEDVEDEYCLYKLLLIMRSLTHYQM
jgi:hypothetical protein